MGKPKGSEGQMEGSEGQLEMSEGLPAGLESQPARSEIQPARSEDQPEVGPTYRYTDIQTDGISLSATGLCPTLGLLPKKTAAPNLVTSEVLLVT